MEVPLGFAIGMDKVMGTLSRIAAAFPAEPPDTSKDLEAYYDIPLDRAFPKPPTPKSVYLGSARKRGAVTVQDFRFDSAHEPICPNYRARHERDFSANRHVMGRILHHMDGHRRPFLVYLHGWMQRGAEIEERVLFPYLQRQLDVDVAHLYLPFHGRRKAAADLIAGSMFWSSDLVRTLEAMRQSVSDIRQVVYYLQQRFGVPVGVAGVSLGGAITMSTLCVEESLAFAIPMIAHHSLPDAITRAEILERTNRELSKRGHTAESLREVINKIGLGRMRPAIPNERQLWINARHDQWLHAETVERQRQEWGSPPIRWYEGSHMSIVFEFPKIIGWCKEFLDGLNLVPRHGTRRRAA